MSKIHLLDKAVAELIAAGEVVERPASVIKELLENSIDAGSTKIKVEIENGGVTLMRITDNGCGIAREDVETAFLRHATSKITTGTDLEEILTLGFRGEALAAIATVANVTIETKTADASVGTIYTISGGIGGTLKDTGCPNGTTLTVQDLFFNTPARMKFLKKDVTEGNAVATVVERLSLSHPEIAFQFLRDGKAVLSTSGDGKLKSAVYSICGRQFAASLIECQGEQNGVKVSGYISRPVSCRPNRNSQYIFLNGRYIKSATVSAALDQAYKNSAMVGKFPAAVLQISLPAGMVDVNVHPAKTEVRFSNEKLIFDAVYTAVKNTLLSKDERPEFHAKPQPSEKKQMPEYRQLDFTGKSNLQRQINTFVEHIKAEAIKPTERGKGVVFRASDVAPATEITQPVPKPLAENFLHSTRELSPTPPITLKEKTATHSESYEHEPVIRYIGEIFSTYILAQQGEDVYLIDKHAAHERILYNQLRSQKTVQQQLLLTPEIATLSTADYGTILENLNIAADAGFALEDFGSGNILIRGLPACIADNDPVQLLSELAENLRRKYTTDLDRLDNLYHTIACKAAIKAGFLSDDLELEQLAQTVLRDKEIMYCPHGRPVAIKLTRTFIEKQFGRIQ